MMFVNMNMKLDRILQFCHFNVNAESQMETVSEIDMKHIEVL